MSTPIVQRHGFAPDVHNWMRSPQRVFWSIIGVGLIVPPATGVLATLLLRSVGQTTWPILGWLPLMLEIPTTLWCTVPFIALAYYARSILSSASETDTAHSLKARLVQGGLIGGALASAATFLYIFWAFQPEHDWLFGPLPPDDVLLIGALSPILAACGIIAGWWIAKVFPGRVPQVRGLHR